MCRLARKTLNTSFIIVNKVRKSLKTTNKVGGLLGNRGLGWSTLTFFAFSVGEILEKPFKPPLNKWPPPPFHVVNNRSGTRMLHILAKRPKRPNRYPYVDNIGRWPNICNVIIIITLQMFSQRPFRGRVTKVGGRVPILRVKLQNSIAGIFGDFPAKKIAKINL